MAQAPAALAHAQLGHRVRMEWGATGGDAVAEGVDVAVVVDVLTFGTVVDLAVGRGVLAAPRVAGPGAVEVAPAGALAADASSTLLLPSATGALAMDLAGIATTVVAASWRNAAAVADWIAREHDEDEARLAVVAAGDHWPDGSLRPALEDLWAAGAVLATLEDHGWDALSPEAAHAADAYRLVAGRERSHLWACAGGQALVAAGREADLELAAEVAGSAVVPLLGDRGFVAAP